MTKYKVTNYGNTRTVYIKGKSWEISKGATIDFDDEEVPEAKEVADAFEELQFVDVEVIKQPIRRKKLKARIRKKKKIVVVKKKKKKKVATKIRKKTKRCKVKRRKK